MVEYRIACAKNLRKMTTLRLTNVKNILTVIDNLIPMGGQLSEVHVTPSLDIIKG